MSPRLNLAMIEVCKISDGIRILEALGEGDLLVSTRRCNSGYSAMATCSIEDLRGRTEDEIYLMLDRRTEEGPEREKQRTTGA